MNYYEELEVSKNASQETIRAAYKSLIQRYHPDKHEGKNHEKLVRLTEAYKTLSDPDLRAIYDSEFPEEMETKSHAPLQRAPALKGEAVTTSHQEKKKQVKEKSFNSFFLILFVLLSLAGFTIYTQTEKNENKKMNDLVAWERVQESIKKTKEEQVEREILWKKEIAKRTTNIFSGYRKIDLNMNAISPCEIQGGAFTLPVSNVLIGRIEFKKIRGSFDSAKALIENKIENYLKSLTICDLSQVDIGEKIEKSMQNIANKTLFGDVGQFYPKCDTIMKRPNGTLSYEDEEFEEYEYQAICRGIEKITLAAPLSIR